MEEIILKSGVSVVVCCYNSAEVIDPTIKALARQEVPPGIGCELILVDNNCTDNTVQLVQDTWKKENSPYPLQIVKETEPGLIYARKTGVLNASYEILLFVDDDNILEPGWITQLFNMYSRWPDVGGIGGYNEFLCDGEKPAWFDEFANMYACNSVGEKHADSGARRTLFGAGLSFRTAMLRSIFSSPLPLYLVGMKKDTASRGEDSEICLRAGLMGWRLRYEKSLKLKHYILKRRLNWDYVLQCRRGGGNADIILFIYQDLLDKKIPRDYRQLSIHISSLWEEFWQNRVKCKDLVKLKKEGDPVALRYYYLQGLTEGFLKLDELEYNSIREKIISFFAHQERLL
jgi:glycosyltransferase involved in cell wall biosynthesis